MNLDRKLLLKSLLWKIDQDDIRVLARPVEHDLFAVRRNIECRCLPVVGQAGDLTAGFLAKSTNQKSDALIRGKYTKPVPIATLAYPHR